MSHTSVPPCSATVRSSGDSTLNLGYTRTIPGLLKVGQTLALFISLVCVCCVHGWPSWAVFQFFQVVALWFLVALFVFLLMHIFRLQKKMPCINWPLTEFFHYSVGSILLFIASVAGAIKCAGASALVVASVFGFLATFLMLVNLWTSYSLACGTEPGSPV